MADLPERNIQVSIPQYRLGQFGRLHDGPFFEGDQMHQRVSIPQYRSGQFGPNQPFPWWGLQTIGLNPSIQIRAIPACWKASLKAGSWSQSLNTDQGNSDDDNTCVVDLAWVESQSLNADQGNSDSSVNLGRGGAACCLNPSIQIRAIRTVTTSRRPVWLQASGLNPSIQIRAIRTNNLDNLLEVQLGFRVSIPQYRSGQCGRGSRASCCGCARISLNPSIQIRAIRTAASPTLSSSRSYEAVSCYLPKSGSRIVSFSCSAGSLLSPSVWIYWS